MKSIQNHQKNYETNKTIVKHIDVLGVLDLSDFVDYKPKIDRYILVIDNFSKFALQYL